MSKAHCLPIHVIGDADAPQLSADIGQQLRDIFRITQETLVKPGALKAAEHFWRPFYIKAVVSVGTNNHFFLFKCLLGFRNIQLILRVVLLAFRSFMEHLDTNFCNTGRIACH